MLRFGVGKRGMERESSAFAGDVDTIVLLLPRDNRSLRNGNRESTQASIAFSGIKKGRGRVSSRFDGKKDVTDFAVVV